MKINDVTFVHRFASTRDGQIVNTHETMKRAERDLSRLRAYDEAEGETGHTYGVIEIEPVKVRGFAMAL